MHNPSVHQIRLTFATFSAFVVASCGGGGGGTEAPPPPPPPPPANNAPEITSGASAAVFENTSDAYVAAATDADSGDSLTYSIPGGADAASFSIDSAAGSVQFVSVPDFENPVDSDGNNVYEIAVAVSDGRDSTSLDVAISVLDVSQLSLEIHFPPDSANLGGDISTTAVSGILVDAEDGEVRSDDVATMTANNVDVSFDADDPASWTVDVPVVDGSNLLSVAVESKSGSQYAADVTVDNSLQFLYPIEIAVDSVGQRVVVKDGPRLLVGDLANGTLSHGARAFPFSLLSSDCEPLAYDGVNGRALYIENDRSLLQSSLNGFWSSSSVDINNPRTSGTSDLCNLQVDATGTLAFVLETIPNPDSQLLSLDLVTGDLTVISGGTVGSGEFVFSFRGLAIDEINGVALSAAPGSIADQLLSIDLETGARTVVSARNSQFPMQPAGLDVIDRQHYLVLDTQRQLAAYSNYELGYVMGINVQTGARHELSGASRGEGPELTQPLGMSFDDSTGQLFVTDLAENSIFAVDPDTGDRTAVFDTGLGDGPSLSFPWDVKLDTFNNRLLVASRKGLGNDRGALYSVDLATGNRRLISGDGAGSGPVLEEILGFDTNLRRNRVLALVFGGRFSSRPAVLMEIDLTTGARNIISGEGIGAGPVFSTLPLSIAVDPANQRAFVADTFADTIYEVDLVTGNRAVLADAATGGGEAFRRPTDVVYDPPGNRLFIGALRASNGNGAIMSVGLDDGLRSVVSEDASTGPAPGGIYSLQINFDGSRLIGFGSIARNARTRRAIFAVDTETGEREQLSFFAPDTQETPNFMPAEGVAYDEAGNRVYVSTQAGRIRVVDLKSGRSAVISD